MATHCCLAGGDVRRGMSALPWLRLALVTAIRLGSFALLAG
ncbi:MAG: hypothetical protein ACR2J5_08685 [Geodermatophilaceae bacterium]